MGGRSTRPGGHHQTPSRVVVPRDTSLLRVPEWVPGRKVYPVGLFGGGQVRPGDLVLYDAKKSLDTWVPPKFGIIIRESNELWFCDVLLSNGQVVKNCGYAKLLRLRAPE